MSPVCSKPRVHVHAYKRDFNRVIVYNLVCAWNSHTCNLLLLLQLLLCCALPNESSKTPISEARHATSVVRMTTIGIGMIILKYRPWMWSACTNTRTATVACCLNVRKTLLTYPPEQPLSDGLDPTVNISYRARHPCLKRARPSDIIGRVVWRMVALQRFDNKLYLAQYFARCNIVVIFHNHVLKLWDTHCTHAL